LGKKKRVGREVQKKIRAPLEDKALEKIRKRGSQSRWKKGEKPVPDRQWQKKPEPPVVEKSGKDKRELETGC